MHYNPPGSHLEYDVILPLSTTLKQNLWAFSERVCLRECLYQWASCYHNLKYLDVNSIYYNPYKALIKDFLHELCINLDAIIGMYDNIIVMGDFNAECNESSMKMFCETYDLTNLINEPTCYENQFSPSSIDLILTNRKKYFQNPSTVDTSLSDFHKMTITVMKMNYKKLEPKKIAYRNYRNFDNEKFRQDVKYLITQYYGNAMLSYDHIENIIMDTMDRLAPNNLKYLRGNHQPFMNKELLKAIVTRSGLKNILSSKPK